MMDGLEVEISDQHNQNVGQRRKEERGCHQELSQARKKEEILGSI